MQILDTLQIVPVWVGPDHLVQSARFLLEGHALPAIAVLDSERKPMGLLRSELAARAPGNSRVGELMEPIPAILDAGVSLRGAADAMIQSGSHYLPVVREGEFRGLVTAMHLLEGLRRSWDPMTTLSWSDELRRWGTEQLGDGKEIAVIFIDLDQFGNFNRKFGHVVGDRVLKKVAMFLAERIDRDHEVLVRYGGDEFAIGTTRDHESAVVLADRLLSDNAENPLTESGEPIRFSVGVEGGKRTNLREDAHVEATLDDLINLASKHALARKQYRKPGESHGADTPPAPMSGAYIEPIAEEEEEDDGLPHVVEVQVEDDPNSLTHVTLRDGGRVWVGVGLRLGRSLGETVAYATSKALERARPGTTMEILSTGTYGEGDEARAFVEVAVKRDGEERRLTAEAELMGDEKRAIAAATIGAFLA